MAIDITKKTENRSALKGYKNARPGIHDGSEVQLYLQDLSI